MGDKQTAKASAPDTELSVIDRIMPLETAHVPDIIHEILNDEYTYGLRVESLLNKCLTPGLTNVVEVPDARGKLREWAVTKGAYSHPETGTVLRLAKPIDRELLKNALYDRITLIEGSDPKVVAATFQGGILFNNDEKLTYYNDEHSRTFINKIINDIRESSEAEQRREQRNSYDRKKSRHGIIRRAITALAVSSVLGFFTPKIIDAADEYQSNRHTEQIEQDAAEAAKDQKAQEAAAQQAESFKQKIVDFDIKYPELTDAVDLKDNSVTAVPSSEQFDAAAFVPSYSTKTDTEADLNGIRTLDLPNQGQCEEFQIPIPTGETIEAEHSADPTLLITATANSGADTLRVCVTNFNQTSDKDVLPTPGQILIKFADK